VVDVARLRANFALVAEHGDDVALHFYGHLFVAHPETRTLFPLNMLRQRDRLLGALGHVVSQVDHLDALVPFLEQLGRDHRKFGRLEAHYPAVGAALLAALRHFSGDQWSPDLEADWTTAYDLVARAMIEAANDAAKTEPAWYDAEGGTVLRTALEAMLATAPPGDDDTPGLAPRGRPGGFGRTPARGAILAPLVRSTTRRQRRRPFRQRPVLRAGHRAARSRRRQTPALLAVRIAEP
jgi:hemoglobin-like flavoprotein